ncbi:DUF350 domain-containing protein [Mucilaginibacter ginsenosidivorans]|uniref:DUF350 domain-containing protein n=1 Tax=Mucilaginibacter ginsenosidivorans TaxID=398053 RepID=A0A5B8UUE4_9SPHI|nr:hypothetical protein [Mucilaginibacter ginsenosidivorans]QEC62508.1 hypothetical protein FRZ54_07870 [Mucilaginibacter ginsenosidivorans]
MKISFLIASGLALALAGLLSYLLLTLISSGFRRKHYAEGAPNLAQGLVLAGKLLAGLILVSGVFGPLRDYLLITAGGKEVLSWALFSFLLLCCCVAGVAYVLVSAFEGFLSGRVFKGRSLVVELAENNVGVGVVRAVLVVGLAVVFLFSMSVFIQAFIPVPAVVSIR